MMKLLEFIIGVLETIVLLMLIWMLFLKIINTSSVTTENDCKENMTLYCKK